LHHTCVRLWAVDEGDEEALKAFLKDGEEAELNQLVLSTEELKVLKEERRSKVKFEISIDYLFNIVVMYLFDISLFLGRKMSTGIERSRRSSWRP